MAAKADSKPAAKEIDAIIKGYGGWKSKTLTRLRDLIKEADPDAFEEVKWKKPSKPAGVPVWSHNGILCIGEALKNAVRLTFPKGARIKDPKKLFNTRLDSNSVRAIDFREGDMINAIALKSLVKAAAEINRPKVQA